MYSLNFVCFELCAMYVFIQHWAVSVQKFPLAVRCLLLETDLTILPRDAESWLV